MDDANVDPPGLTHLFCRPIHGLKPVAIRLCHFVAVPCRLLRNVEPNRARSHETFRVKPAAHAGESLASQSAAPCETASAPPRRMPDIHPAVAPHANGWTFAKLFGHVWNVFCKAPADIAATGRDRIVDAEVRSARGADAVQKAAVITDWTELALDLSDPETLLMTAGAEVRRRMNLTDANVKFDISNERTIDAAAVYQKGSMPVISVAIETLQDPLRTVTALAHEYAHHILLGDGAANQADVDERFTDLVPICYGFGVLQSDASLYFDNWSMGEWSGWQASKYGYLTAQEIGYALALFARARGESNPRWKRWLRADSKVTLKQALRNFRDRNKRGLPLLFDADRIPGVNSSSRELVDWLSGSDPTFALAAAWRLCDLDQFDLPTIEALHRATRSSDPDLVPVAIGLLAGADDRDQATLDRVAALLRDRRPQVALAAAKAAYGLGMDLTGHTGTLVWLLDKTQGNAIEVLKIIGAQGPTAVGIDSKICSMLLRSLKSLDDRLTMALIDCLRKISGNPQQAIESTLAAGPIRDEALEWLKRSV